MTTKPQTYEKMADDAREALAMQRLGAERQNALGKVPITVVDDDEQDDMLAQTLLGQERDLVSHRVNLVRYETILNNGAQGTFRARIAMLLLQTLDRLEDVTGIVEALTPQLPGQARLDAAVARVKAREDAARPGNAP